MNEIDSYTVREVNSGDDTPTEVVIETSNNTMGVRTGDELFSHTLEYIGCVTTISITRRESEVFVMFHIVFPGDDRAITKVPPDYVIEMLSEGGFVSQ